MAVNPRWYLTVLDEKRLVEREYAPWIAALLGILSAAALVGWWMVKHG